MKKYVLAMLASAMVCAPVAGQTFSEDRIKADMRFLAHDLLEGRNTGTRGYDLAAEYVASRYLALGLTPPVSGSYFQQVPFVLSSIKASPDSFISFGGKTWRNGEEVVLSGTSVYPDQSEDHEVVFVGYGFDAPQYGFKDYAGLDVRGKIVAFLTSLPGGAPSDVVAELGDKRTELAQSKGAIGAIGISTPQTLKQLPWEQWKQYGAVPRLRWLHADGTPNVVAPGLRVGGSLGPKAAEELFAGSAKTIDKIYAQIEDPKARPKGFAIPGKLHFERHSAVDKMSSPNVVGLIPGSDPKLADEVVLFMAHLDHDGIVKPVNGDSIMNGAMDNASGVATMLEAAQAFLDAPARPRRSIMFAAVTAEEDGLLGSEYLAKHPVTNGKKVVAVVNLDMPILTYDFKDLIAFGAEHSTMGPAVERALQTAGVALSPDPMPEEGLFTRSDHYNFVKEGIPSIFLATGWAGPGKAAFDTFFANNYHQVSDEVDLPIDWKAAARFARINYEIGRELANADSAPLWYEGSYFGDKFAKGATKAKRP
ncbi:M20/M25/M40 family metallo-hydrolase [Sphingomonas sp. NSE70-1]|uniref:M20/M25/M40 family metallo-hydrolase n=1 Tax=Sphingomonas caseinilyticus TaxID=2908205 RepID=A0ABT0RS27_9SPHN|nr:M20/M25/M40 family metallo-hydrolase [Sphingomonas caseinilyticus]MCL6697731.1 M20/M25/M40 family metallo-hydrolase [Sphingomonas caseinilyticus]